VKGSLLLAVLLLGAVAQADGEAPFSLTERKQRARALYEEGRAQANLGHFAAAMSAFERAYVLQPLPLFLYDLAQLSAVTGDPARAIQLYDQYLIEAPNAPERNEVERRIRELTKERAKQAVVPASPAIPPPPPTAAPPPPVAATQVVVEQAALPAQTPHRRRAWIAGVVVGAAVVVAGAVTLGVLLGRPEVDPTPSLGKGHLQ
jgi:tetratricopeptide (TPR) repeat protein